MTEEDDLQAELDRYYTEVGRLSVEFATLETWMHFIAWNALGLDVEAGSVVTERMGADGLVGLLRSLSKRRLENDDEDQPSSVTAGSYAARLDPELVQRVDALAREFKAVADDRNKVIHGGFPLGGGLIRVRSVLTDFQRGREPERLDLPAIRAIANRCSTFSLTAAPLLTDILRSRGFLFEPLADDET